MEKASTERKFLKAGSQEYANTILAERRAYTLVEMKPPVEEGGEEEPKQIQFNGAAVRTPAEDIVWEE